MKNKNRVHNKEELRKALDAQGISQPNFAKAYYFEEVDEKASEDKLDSHYNRFKSLLKDTQNRSPERLAAYINYFNRAYRGDGKHTQADKHAAWEMYIELETRVATQPLENGKLVCALESLASLFTLNRSIAKKYGPNSQSYFELVSRALDCDLRPFTSKWHAQSEHIDEKSFRNELEVIQKRLNELKDDLYDICV